MARYCFYCGRELASNEKCHCQARTRAESAARAQATAKAASEQKQNNNEQKTNSKNNNSTNQSSDSSTSSKQSTYRNYNSYTQSTNNTENKKSFIDKVKAFFNERKNKRAARKAERQAEKERMRQAKEQAKRYEKAKKEQKQKAYQNYNAQYGSANYARSPNQGNFGRNIIMLITMPATAIRSQAEPFWSAAHTFLLIIISLLGGYHYSKTNLWLHSIVYKLNITAPRFSGLSLYMAGVLATIVLLIIYSGILWLLARFIFRQRALPFTHALAVGKSSWIYLALFMLVALPATMQGGLFGILVIIFGLTFSALVHARSLAYITHLNNNQTINLTLLTIIIFTTIFSSFITFYQNGLIN